MSDEVLISISIITYNQENFIKQAIDGVLNQKVNFEYELIIGDDCSTDNTKKILLEYKNKYPKIISLILHEKKGEGIPGKKNFISTIEAATGKYIALCDGDDYWTDISKLQKQVDFLEANPEYSICFHAVNFLQDGEEGPALNQSDKEETYSISDLANTNIISTPSVVYRNRLFEKLPDWFNESPIGDYVLHMLNAKKGLIKYFPQQMAVYRIHKGGVWRHNGIDTAYPKLLWVLGKLKSEDFEENVIKKLSEQKNRVFNEYIGLLLYKKEYDLLNESFKKYYKNDEIPDIDFTIKLLTQQISSLDNEITEIKRARAYKFTKKLSYIKYKYSKRFSKK